ncbi:MAG: hypothetical protein KJ574_00965, partial [Nanoarchaeota archaeon]|nr:hypothetical protein [Nanoarchaeota archaeon]
MTIALHFWDYSALERIITLNGNNTRYIPNEAHVTPNKTLQGFTGKQLTDYAPDHRLKRGYIREFPVAVEGVDDIYLFVQP